MEKLKKLLKVVAFVLVFVLLLNVVSTALVAPNDYRCYQWVGQFYENEKDSLDAVYLGSSAAYAYWCPTLAWEDYGITVWNYTTPRQPLLAAKYLIEDCRKTQKDALYIVNLNRTAMSYDKTAIHYLLDYMPFSVNKLKLTKALCDFADIQGEDTLQYYFPLELYHTRWNALTAKDFEYKSNKMMSSPNYTGFITGIYNNTEEEIIVTDQTSQPEQKYIDVLDDLLDYCDEKDVNILFTISSQLFDSDSRQLKMNYAKQYVTERGYKVLDFCQEYPSTNLDITQDFYNTEHANIHGAIKLTDYLGKYLVENYDFENKRGKEGYEAWDESIDVYKSAISSSVLPFEYETENRDYSLKSVEYTDSSYDGESIHVSWEASEGAQGYKVYRKTLNNDNKKQSPYSELMTLTADQTSFTDADFDAKNDGTYSFTYVVVPFKTVSGVTKYGSFRYAGTTVRVE